MLMIIPIFKDTNARESLLRQEPISNFYQIQNVLALRTPLTQRAGAFFRKVSPLQPTTPLLNNILGSLSSSL